jgi:PKD repeat protein
MMKKTYLVVLLSLITSLGFSQMTFEGSLSHDKNPLKKDLSQYEKKNLNTASRAEGTWVGLYDALVGDVFGTAASLGVTTLFPDSNMIFLDNTGSGTDDVGAPNFMNGLLYFAHGASQTYDPACPVWGAGYESEALFAPTAKHIIDSLRLYYLYDRNINATKEMISIDSIDTMVERSVIDTLRVFIVRIDDPIQDFAYSYTTSSTGESPFIYIPYDSSNLGPQDLFLMETIDILLDSNMADNGTDLATLTVDLGGLEILGTEKFTYTLAFIPGNEYSFGDTLVSFEETPSVIANPTNQFQIVTFEEEEGGDMLSQELSEELTYNYASMAFTDQRYMDTASFWGNEYYTPAHWYTAGFPLEQILCEYYISFAAADFLTSVDGREVTVADNSSFESKTVTWDFGDDSGNSKIGAEATYEYDSAATYTITMTAKEEGTNASYSTTKKVTTSWYDNVQEVEELMNVSVFPNPATDNLIINVDLNNAETVTVQVMDMYGRIAYTETLNGNSYRNNISVSNFATGIYQVKVVAGENTITNNVYIGK